MGMALILCAKVRVTASTRPALSAIICWACVEGREVSGVLQRWTYCVC